ncbi:MAG: hypothetical protein PHC43_10130 [Candidatus Marinimicrobia bacterium]|nr:hypothetical protein [Candidatus Neomarinimicrobiota bacterium]
MKQDKLFKSFIYLLAVVIVSFVAGYVVFATWSGPATAPPDSNPNPPIIISTSPQAKSGRISAKAFLDYNDPEYYLKDDYGNMRLSGNLSFESALIDYTRAYNIYDPTAQYLNTFDPSDPGNPKTFTGVIPLDALPY